MTENADEAKRFRSDLIVDLGSLSKEFRALGGDPGFLRYALTGALFAEPPEKSIAEINAFLIETINPKYLLEVQRDAQALIGKLDAIAGISRDRPVVRVAADALKALVAWIKDDDVAGLLLKRPRGGQVGPAWRYPFFAAIWPYLQAVSKASVRKRWGWMQEFFTAGDAIAVVDEGFLRRSLKTGGIKFVDLMKPAFRISKRRDTGNWETARSWFATARDAQDISLRGMVANGADDFLIWHHKLFLRRVPDYEIAPVRFTSLDRQYAEKAWAMFRDDFGYEKVPSPPAFLLDRCLRSAAE